MVLTLCTIFFIGVIMIGLNLLTPCTVQDGVAGLWNMSLHFQRGNMLDEGLDRGVGQKVAKKGTLWVTDCITMTNCNKLVLSSNSRELMFYDISTTIYNCQFRLHGNYIMSCGIFGVHVHACGLRQVWNYLSLSLSPPPPPPPPTADLPSVPLCLAHYSCPEVNFNN